MAARFEIGVALRTPLKALRIRLGRHIAFVGVYAAVDQPLRPLVPRDVDGEISGIEDHGAVGQVVVDPPGELAPIQALGALVDEPGADDAGHSAVRPATVGQIPYVCAGRVLVTSAIQIVGVTECIQQLASESGADMKAAETRLERLENLCTEPAADRQRQVGVIRNIRKAVLRSDLAVEEVAHVERRRQPRAAELFKRLERPRALHARH